jgi:hypothetical protein
MRDPELIGLVQDVRGDTVTAALTVEAIPGLTFSRGHAYQVGQVGAFVRIPIGLVDLFAIVVQVGATPRSGVIEDDEAVTWAAQGQAWMRLELVAEAARGGRVSRGVSRYPAIGDPVQLVTSADMSRLYGVRASSSYVRVGHIANATHLPAYVDLNALVARHGAVVGSTGSGKSSAVSALLHRIADARVFPSSRVVVVDIHGEYGGGLGDLAHVLRVAPSRSRGANAASPAQAGDVSSSGSLVLPYWALNYEEFQSMTFGELDDTGAAAVQGWILVQKRTFVSRHVELCMDPAEVTVDSPIPFSVRRLWYEFHEAVYATHTAQQNAQSPATRAYELDGSGRPLAGDAETVRAPTYKALVGAGLDRVYLSASNLNMRRQLDRLAGLLRDPRYNFLFRPGLWSPSLDGEVEEDLSGLLEQWLGARSIVVADLSNVPAQVLGAVVAVLLRILYDAMVWARDLPEGGRERPLLFVLEEAHRYLNGDSDRAAAVVERVVKEGRKYGSGILLVSQRPSEIRATILSQIGTFFVMRLTNSADRGIVRATVPDHLSGLLDAVSVLRTGEAILVGEAVSMPTRVVFEVPENERPDSSDPRVVAEDGSSGWTRPKQQANFERVSQAWRLAGNMEEGEPS